MYFCIVLCRVKGATSKFLKLGVREKPVSVLKSPATSLVMSFLHVNKLRSV